MDENLRRPGPEIVERYRKLGERPGATGRDAAGRLVRREKDSSLRLSGDAREDAMGPLLARGDDAKVVERLAEWIGAAAGRS